MSFEDASRELGISEEELEQLVAAGEIASVKEGDTLYFKKSVVQKFKKSRESSGTPTILLSDEEINLLEDEELEVSSEQNKESGKAAPTEPLVGAKKDSSGRIEISLDDLDNIDLMQAGEADRGQETKELATPTPSRVQKPVEISDDETLLNLEGVLEEDSEGTTPVPAATEGDSTLMDTDLLDLGGLGGESDPFAADTVEEAADAEITEAGTLLRGGGARVMQMKRKRSHAAWTVVLAASAVLLILPLGILTNLLFAHAPQPQTEVIPPESTYGWIMDFNFLDGFVENIADFFKSS